MVKHAVSFIGSGRVAGALCRQMFSSGFCIDIIASRNEKTGRKLAGECNAGWSRETAFPDHTDIVIVAVPDDSLQHVLSEVKCGNNTVVAHTAGSRGLDVFGGNISHRGIFYPLQTFSEGRKTEFRELPVFIEGSDARTEDILRSTAEELGAKVYFTGEEKRYLLHVAAVFVNNFTNFMLTSGWKITEKAELPFTILEPLIRETVAKAAEAGPEKSQTGPAVRFDTGTIEKHINLLSFSPDLQKIYKEMTELIISYYKNN